ncbi:MAG: 50S ribosomal protein L10 [Planctomycetota bacterium]|jgi:large subunit ribosomal protein L10
MSKPVKDLITKEYRRLYGEVDSACVVSVIGLDAISTNKLRGELHGKGICLRVIKNSLARRAFADSALEPLNSVLEGPCALVTGGDSAIDLAKVLVDIRKSYPQIELKRGILGGDPEPIEVDQLAKMKNKDELLAELAGLLCSPGRRLAGCLMSPGGRLAGCLKTMADKAEGSEAA